MEERCEDAAVASIFRDCARERCVALEDCDAER